MAKIGTHRTGPIGKSEAAEIQAMFPVYSDEEIAKKTNRNTSSITKLRTQTPALLDYENRKDYIAILHTKHYWKKITEQLTFEEVKFFENEWAAYSAQFQELTHTDELTLLDTIILTIELNRILVEKKDLIDTIDDTQKLLDKELKLGDSQDTVRVMSYRETLTAMRSAQPAISRRFLETQSRKDEKFKQLKATREQRYKSIEESKKNIFELLKQLDTVEVRAKENRMLSLMTDATKKERERLMEPIQFADQMVDSCLLSAETMDYLDEKYKEEEK